MKKFYLVVGDDNYQYAGFDASSKKEAIELFENVISEIKKSEFIRLKLTDKLPGIVSLYESKKVDNFFIDEEEISAN